MEYKKCHVCGKEFSKKYFCSKKQWENQKCCSTVCHIKRITVLKTGKPRYDLTENRKGTNNPGWIKDDSKLKYSSVHSWISRKFGKACKCEHCKKEKKRYEWSNKDHQYKRNITNWQQVCVSCHKIYDRTNNQA